MRNKRKPSYVEEEEAMEEEKWEEVPEEGPEDVDEKVQVQRMEQVCYHISKENLVSGSKLMVLFVLTRSMSWWSEQYIDGGGEAVVEWSDTPGHWFCEGDTFYLLKSSWEEGFW